MAASTVAVREEPQVPALAQTPAMTITAEDIALPRLYIGQFMSKAVQEKLVDLGDIYSATGSDDPDPQVLWQLAEKDKPGVLFHVLNLRKAKSFSDGGELQLFDFDDPDAPADSWVTYNYTLALPEIDEDVPFKLTLTKTGRPAAQAINTVLAKTAIVGPAYQNAFRITTAERSNNKGKYAVARVTVTEADKKHVAVVEKMFALIGPSSYSAPATAANEPSI